MCSIDELVFQVWTEKNVKGKEMFIDCSDQSHTAALVRGKKAWRLLTFCIIDFFIYFSVSRSTPPSCGLLCPWHIVRVALSHSHSPPITPPCARTLRKLSCKIILLVQAGL